jgi:hypothetical protein
MPTVPSLDQPRAILPGGAEDLIWGKFHWGEFASEASLPNVADDGKLLNAGDLASVGGRLYECRVKTSGSAKWHPVTALTHPTRVFNVPVNGNAANLAAVGTDAAADAATSLYYTEIFVPHRMTVTGIGVLNGTTVGTDKLWLALYDSAGAFVEGTLAAGTLGAGADVFQQVALIASTVIGPGKYFVGLMLNGTTHQNQRLSAGSPMVICEKEGGHTFGDEADITSLATTFTADVAPVVYLY